MAFLSRRSDKLLLALTVFLGAASLPVLADPPEDDPPNIVTVVPFSGRKASGNECTDEGPGCVITVFDDGTVTARTVGN